MRKVIVILGSIVAAIVIVVVSAFFYAANNLSSIIAHDRGRVLTQVSGALGRKVEVREIKTQIGWGVSADFSGVTIADDPTFSSKPFIQASNVFVRLAVLPLLAREIRVTGVILEKPQIRIVRNAAGQFNAATIGQGANNLKELGTPALPENVPQGGSLKAPPMDSITRKTAVPNPLIKNFAVRNGVIIVQDYHAPSVKLTSVDVSAENFSLTSPFQVSMALSAIPADRQNLKLAGSIGPVTTAGAINFSAMPVDIKLTAGPLSLTEVRKIPLLAKLFPARLEFSDSVIEMASAAGRLDSLRISAATDLTPNRVAFAGWFEKPSGAPLKISVEANRSGSEFHVSLARVMLRGMQLKATDIRADRGEISCRIDTDRFEVSQLARLIPPVAREDISGTAEIHTGLRYAVDQLTANGEISLERIAVPKPGVQGMAISGLSGKVKLEGAAADAGPLTFKLSDSLATLTVHAEPLYPVNLSFTLNADLIRPSDFLGNRSSDEQLRAVSDHGSLTFRAFGPDIENKLLSPSGIINDIAYKELSLTTSLEGKRLRLMDLRVQAFGGTVAATAETRLEPGAPFKTSLSMANVNLQQALASQHSTAANLVHGLLSGRADLSGKIGRFDDTKQFLLGSGDFQVARGKLLGVNIAAVVLKKADKIPGVGELASKSLVDNHPELFKNPDTNIESSSLRFEIKGPRIASKALTIKAADYSLTAEGWFDMDRNIDMNAHILLTRQLTREIMDQKSAVKNVTDKNQQIAIPVRLTGQLPEPMIMPGAPEIEQRSEGTNER